MYILNIELIFNIKLGGKV